MAKAIQADWTKFDATLKAGERRPVELERPTAPGAMSPGAARRAPPDGRAPGEPRNVAWLYILPGLAFFGLFTLAPLLHTALAVVLRLGRPDASASSSASTTTARRLGPTPTSARAFGHSAELILFYAVVPVGLGLLLTAFLTRHPVRGFTFFRTVLFLPQTIAGVVVAQAFVWFYARSGPAQRALGRSGSARSAAAWLGDFAWALPAVGAIGTWVTFGLCMVLFLAGVQKIPSVAVRRGARRRRRLPCSEFFAVTLPGLRNELVVAFVLTTINALRNFDLDLQRHERRAGRRDLRAVAADVPDAFELQPGRLWPRDRRRRSRSSSSLVAIGINLARRGGTT